MDKKNQQAKKHISAAKEWLYRAEQSVENDNSIRSDLDIMLAQAELVHAKEKSSIKVWKKRLYWIVPWTLAVLVAVGYVLYLRPSVPSIEKKADIIQPEAIEATISQEVKDVNTLQDSTSINSEPIVEKEDSSILNDNSSIPIDTTPTIDADYEGGYSAPVVSNEEVSSREESFEPTDKANNLSDETMEDLIVSAGQMLRE